MGTAKREREVKDFRHEEARRKNNPLADIVPAAVRERRTTGRARDRRLALARKTGCAFSEGDSL